MSKIIIYENLELRLGLQFKNRYLLEKACTHKSFAIECQTDDHYEKFELLGDAILDFLVLESLMEYYEKDTEGQLSKKRASLVNQSVLYDIACEIRLGDYIRLSRGEEKSGGLHKPSILSSVVEAILGALYQDSGIDSCRILIKKWFGEKLKDSKYFELDFKTKLQEFIQGTEKVTPTYRMTRENYEGDLFSVGVFVGDLCLAEGKGRSKKEAEQKAAELALKLRRKKDDFNGV